MVMMKYKILSDLIFILLITASYCHADISKQRLDVKNHLKSVNKYALKSIKSPDGDIIDCVDIYKQPAFDHPSLKNHTIQMRPSSHPNEQSLPTNRSVLKSNENDPKTITQLWQNSGSCPSGTIPIRRTKEEDVLRASSIKSYGKKNFKNIINPEADNNGHEYAVASATGKTYLGSKVSMSVWKPAIQGPEEFSNSQLWISNGIDSSLNTVEAGWMVHSTFADGNPRLFTYWTGDGYKNTGCYNLLCPGFVQTNNKVVLGGVITPVSGYQSSQYEIFIDIWKDSSSGNWWLNYGNDTVGYWPASLFPNLKSSSTVQMGGEVYNTKPGGQHTTTQMGSGHFPDEGFGKASFFRNIRLVDDTDRVYIPEELDLIATQRDCYNIQLEKWTKHVGRYFFFGGPGRNPKCP